MSKKFISPQVQMEYDTLVNEGYAIVDVDRAFNEAQVNLNSEVISEAKVRIIKQALMGKGKAFPSIQLRKESKGQTNMGTETGSKRKSSNKATSKAKVGSGISPNEAIDLTAATSTRKSPITIGGNVAGPSLTRHILDSDHPELRGTVIREMNPDGNCGFRAIAYFLFNDQSKYRMVRKALAIHFDRNRHVYFGQHGAISSFLEGNRPSQSGLGAYLVDNAENHYEIVSSTFGQRVPTLIGRRPDMARSRPVNGPVSSINYFLDVNTHVQLITNYFNIAIAISTTRRLDLRFAPTEGRLYNSNNNESNPKGSKRTSVINGLNTDTRSRFALYSPQMLSHPVSIRKLREGSLRVYGLVHVHNNHWRAVKFPSNAGFGRFVAGEVSKDPINDNPIFVRQWTVNRPTFTFQ